MATGCHPLHTSGGLTVQDLSALIKGAAVIGRLEPGMPTDSDVEWSLGPVVLGPAQQAANILTRGHTAEVGQRLGRGPDEAVALLIAVTGRPELGSKMRLLDTRDVIRDQSGHAHLQLHDELGKTHNMLRT